MTITELAQSTGVSKHTLRYYERVGLIPLVARHSSSGHRVYTSAHTQWVTFIRNLRATGMPIRELCAYSRLVSKGDQTWPDRKAILAAHRSRIDAMIAILEAQRDALDEKLALGCAPSGLRADPSRARRRGKTSKASSSKHASQELPA
jgi:DNA-binding transcriptional MerR regulator